MLGCPSQKQTLVPRSRRPREEKKRKVGLHVSTYLLLWQFSRNHTSRGVPLCRVHLKHSFHGVLSRRKSQSPWSSGLLWAPQQVVGGLVIASADLLVRLGPLCLTRVALEPSGFEGMAMCRTASRLDQSPMILKSSSSSGRARCY